MIVNGPKHVVKIKKLIHSLCLTETRNYFYLAGEVIPAHKQ
jgi:hypothetical protein